MILQTLCVVAAGYALWRLWGVIARRGVLVSVIVGFGLIARSVGGQLLFWVSYLKLPYGRSMQLGDGLWFYGLDALHYYGIAKSAAHQGLWSVLTLSPLVPSVLYVKMVGIFLWLFGSTTSTAILLNLFTYLGTAALIVVWAERRRVDRRVTALTLAAISVLPSSILWSLQPLKDAFVLFLAVLFAFMLDFLAASWRAESGRARTGRVVFATLMLAATTYTLAGIRWYYALIMLAAASIPLLAIIVGARGGRATAMRAAVVFVLMIVLTQNVVAGAGTYLPERMRAILRPWSERGEFVRPIGVVSATVAESRENFDRYKDAGTRIRAGAAVAEQEREMKETQPAEVAAAAPPPATTTQPAVTATTAPPAAEAKRTPAPAAEPVRQPEAKPPAPAPAPIQKSAPVQAAPAPVQKSAPVQKPAPVQAAPAPVRKSEPVQAAPAPVRKSEPVQAEPAPRTAPAPMTQPATPAPAPAATTSVPQVQSSPEMDVPTTDAGRLIAGLAALLLPLEVANAVGLVSIGGGRGLMWFVDFDTILFDIVLIAGIVLFFRGLRRGAWRDSFLWYLVVATIIMTAALAYTVSNFGTLFRHRQMVVATLALIGLAAARPRRPEAEMRTGEAT